MLTKIMRGKYNTHEYKRTSGAPVIVLCELCYG